MEKPKLHIKTPIIAKVFNAVAVFLFLSSIIYLLTQWSLLPEKVPTHYNVLGEPDNWGNKVFIFTPIIIAILLWVGLHLLEKYPHLHNNSSLTAENMERQYKNSSMLLNFIKNEILLFFAFSSWNDVWVGSGKDRLLGIWELPLLLVVIFSTLAFFINRSFRIK